VYKLDSGDYEDLQRRLKDDVSLPDTLNISQVGCGSINGFRRLLTLIRRSEYDPIDREHIN
jgi:hypothetical protein